MEPQLPLRSGDLAKLVGVSPDTLRLYERKGLLCPPRSANGYRCYPPEVVERIHLIRAALSIGFTLGELAEILAIRDARGIPCTHVRQLAADKLKRLDYQIRELTELRSQMRALLSRWDRLLATTPKGKQARLLQAWAATSGSRRKLHPLRVSLTGKLIHKDKHK
jgi:DNA-binding transcriptional MerR regulator